ncbi:MAG: putative metal-binding motif-containing protein [Deltaproteobacteria bacterium]|nr:putative metal-binding motif-containing protein [Deltaproteobacteria bacterium]
MKTLTLGLTFTLLTALTACVGDAGTKDDVEDSSAPDDSSSTGDDDSGGGGDDSKGSDDSEAPDNDKDNDGYDADEDCDDSDRAVNPGATESCDGVDNDCDGDVDDADDSVTGQSECYTDNDLDGYGAGAAVGEACECPEGQASLGEDCDDNDFYRSPGTVEECDGGIDNDCDELVDADDPSLAEGNTYYLDKDGDKYGDDSTGIRSCSRIAGRITTGGDCDDGDKTINPGVEEICEDEIDNDCTDGVDDGCGGDTGGGGDYETWTGASLFYYGFDTKTGTLQCEMYWENSGTPSSMSCPDCDFTFDVDFVYDEASSSYRRRL